MARIIEFHPKMTYHGEFGASLENWSEIFEVTDIARLDVELRVFGVSSGTPITWGQIWTTSDAGLLETSWKQVGSTLLRTGVGVTSGVFSGFQRFAMAKLIVPAGAYLTAYMRAVGRPP